MAVVAKAQQRPLVAWVAVVDRAEQESRLILLDLAEQAVVAEQAAVVAMAWAMELATLTILSHISDRL